MCSASLKGGPVTCLPMTVPRGIGSSMLATLRDHTQKNQAPDCSEARPYTARGVHPHALPLIFNIVTTIAAVKLLRACVIRRSICENESALSSYVYELARYAPEPHSRDA
jgi:hypothetical protein